MGRLLEPLLKTGLSLIRNVLKPLAKSVFILLRWMAVVWALDVHQKMFGSGFTTLIISNEEMNDIMKIVKSLEESRLLLKGVSKTIKNKAKEQKGGCLRMVLEVLGANLLWSLVTGKNTMRAINAT